MNIAIIFPIIGFAVSGFFFWQGRGAGKKKKLIEDLKTSKINLLAEGIAEVSGHVELKDKLKAPFSGEECCYYKYSVEEKHTKKDKHGHTSESWRAIREEEKKVPFYIDDGTGKALVYPDGAQHFFKKDSEYHSSFGKDPPEHIKNFLKQNNISFEGFLGMNKTMRYSETFIKPKDKLFIIGNSKKEDGDYALRKGDFFLISDCEEKDVIADQGRQVTASYIAAVITFLISIGVFFFFIRM